MSVDAGPRHVVRRRVAASIGVVIGILLPLAIFAASGVGVVDHTNCKLGTLEADENFWTPFSLVNAPYSGSASYVASFNLWELFGPTHVTANGILTNGNISTGYFETQNWSVYDALNQTVLGPGLNQPCSSRYTVELAHTTFDVSDQGVPLQGPGNTSNANEPTTFSPDGRPAATFVNGFVAANMPPISTCGKPSQTLTFNSTAFDVSITIQTSHGPVPVVFSILSLESFTYHFPANGGTWQIDDAQHNARLRGPGLAFSWTTC